MGRPSGIRVLPLVLSCILLAPTAPAQTYSVEVQPLLDGLPIKIDTVPTNGLLVVRLTNEGDARTRCDLRYDASPQPVHRAYVYLEPGETKEDAFRARRKWFNVVLEVICKAVPQS